MLLVGKVYLDYLVNASCLDGKSHYLHPPRLGGGLANLFHREKFLDITSTSFFKDTIYCLIPPYLEVDFSSLANNLVSQIVYISSPPPVAFIIEGSSCRTSFVSSDSPCQINLPLSHQGLTLLYYADKLTLPDDFHTSIIFADTACNEENDMYFDFRNNADTVIVGISTEYLSPKLLSYYLQFGYKVVSHSPRETTIYNKNDVEVIPNDWYISSQDLSVTGLGDQYTYLLAKSIEDGVSLSNSVRNAQLALHHVLS